MSKTITMIVLLIFALGYSELSYASPGENGELRDAFSTNIGGTSSRVKFSKFTRYPSCMSTENAKLCLVYGPISIELIGVDNGSSFPMKFGQHEYSICYFSDVRMFCDRQTLTNKKNEP